MKRLFHGGIHPADAKQLSSGQVLRPAPAPQTVVMSMLQHIGAPCEPLVKPGQTVKLGQKIGDADGLCVPVHASVSGTVLAVEPRPHPSGRDVMSVVIQNDFRDTVEYGEKSPADVDRYSAQELMTAIREAGVVGMGGATFPTDVKARSGMGKVDTLIANACECEPYITADDTLLRTWPDRVLEGLRLMGRMLRPDRIVLGVEENKPEAIEVLEKRLAGDSRIRLQVLPARYPQGGEKQLIEAVTGRQVPPGELPSAVGCAVFNVATLAAVYEAVVLGTPLTRRIVTVTGEGVHNPQNFLVRIGTPFRQVIEAAGGLKRDTWKVLSGGPMTGIPQDDLEVPVLKGTNAVVCLTQERKDERDHPTCIRCGRCVAVCPVYLQPLYLYHYERSKNIDGLVQMNMLDCIECGCCAYVCPGKLPLVERFRAGKRAVREGTSK